MLSSQQQKIATYFNNAVASASVRHAYIISGQDGMGKKHLSGILRHYFACHTNSACGACPGCKSDSAGANPDVVCLSNPEKKPYKIDEIRELIKRVYERPVYGKYKLMVIEEAHLLDERCQNALLKAIEEPPSYAVFIFLCDNMSTVLQTILSRVMVIELLPWKKEELKAAYPLPESESFLYDYCMGNIGRLKSICDDEDFKDARDTAVSVLSKVLGGDCYAVYEAVDEFTKRKEHITEMLSVLTLFMRDIVFLKKGLGENILNSDKKIQLKLLSDTLTSGQALEIAELLGKETSQIRHNENMTMQIQTMFMKIASTTKNRL